MLIYRIKKVELNLLFKFIPYVNFKLYNALLLLLAYNTSSSLISFTKL
jgi:hypothetical protein